MCCSIDPNVNERGANEWEDNLEQSRWSSARRDTVCMYLSSFLPTGLKGCCCGLPEGHGAEYRGVQVRFFCGRQ